MVRRILAAVTGYMLFVVATPSLFRLTGRDPHSPQSTTFMVVSTLYGVAFAALGGYVAAVLGARLRKGERARSTD